MSKLIASLAFILLSLPVFAQQSYITSKDPENSSVVFKGPMTFKDLRSEPSFGWFTKGEEAYKPDSTAIQYLRGTLPKYVLVVVMGTWCEDSQNLIPKLSKTLTAAAFPMNQLALFGVDRSKKTTGAESEIYRIQLVPTIIVMRGTEEVGRITENVKRDIETDLAQIVHKAEG